MRRNYSGAVFFLTVCIIALFSLIGSSTKDRCIVSGCSREKSYGSSYCYRHKPGSYSGSYSSGSKSTTSGSSGYKSSTGSTSAGSSSGKSGSSSSKSNSYNRNTTSSGGKSKKSYSGSMRSYDAGYDDIYDNDDYDWDRYYSDADYADGVDDAMDELDW